MRWLILLFLPLWVLGCPDGGAPDGGAGDGGAHVDGGADAGSLDGGGVDGGAGDGGLVDDGGVGSTGCLPEPGGMIWDDHVLHFAGDQHRVALSRHYIDIGVGESLLFGLDAFVVETGPDNCLVIDDPAALAYENTHHNWGDVAEAEHEQTLYRLEVVFFPGADWTITLHRLDDQGQPLAEPEMLIATGGPVVGYNGNPSRLPILLNEVMVNNASFLDPNENPSPWVELYNPSSGDFVLDGYRLTDDEASPDKLVFDTSDIILRHETLVVWLPPEFDLAQGGTLMLSAPSGRGPGMRTFSATAPDQSHIFDWTSGGYVITDEPTPGADNPNALDE